MREVSEQSKEHIFILPISIVFNIIIIENTQDMEDSSANQGLQLSKSLVTLKKRNSTGQNKQFYKWNIKQNLKYIEALYLLRDDLQYQFHRRSQKVFIKMSKIINTKHADQCRTHHQKMMERFKDIWTIIAYFKYKASLPKQARKKRMVDNNQGNFDYFLSLSKKMMDADSRKIQQSKSQNINHKIHPEQSILDIQFEQPEFPTPIFQTPQIFEDSKQEYIQKNVFIEEYVQMDSYEPSLNWNIDWHQFYEAEILR